MRAEQVQKLGTRGEKSEGEAWKTGRKSTVERGDKEKLQKNRKTS